MNASAVGEDDGEIVDEGKSEDMVSVRWNKDKKEGEKGERGRVDNGSTSIERDTNDLSSSRTTTEDEAHSGTLLGPK